MTERNPFTNTRFSRFVPSYKSLLICPSPAVSQAIAMIRRRKTLPAFLVATVAVGLMGCASVEVKRGKDLATAGIQYTRATVALVEVATDAMIDADSEAQVRTKLPSAALSRPDFTPDKLRGRLEKLNEVLLQNTKLFVFLRASLSNVEGYFAALQTLADNSQSEATASAVSTISDRVNALNKVLKGAGGPVKPILSDEQKTALSGLSKLVADQVHGAKVAAALRRDAPIIGEALLQQEMILNLAESIISSALTDQTNRFFVDRVQRPYERQEIDAAWVVERNQYIKAKAATETSKELQVARAASKQMSKAWEKILSGVYDTSEMRQQIEEVETLVAALVAIKEAEKPKAPAQ